MARRLRTHRLLTGFLLLALVGGCGSDSGDDGGNGPVFNRPPTVEEIAVSDPYLVHVPGDVVGASVDAGDPDGDALTYRWSWKSARGGDFVDADSTSASVSVLMDAAPGNYDLQVTVSDGRHEVVKERRLGQGSAVPALPSGQELVLDRAGSPWVLLDDLTVPPGATLRVQAGVTVQLRRRFIPPGTYSRSGITVQGDLVVDGALNQRASFLPNEADEDPTHDGITAAAGGDLILRHFTLRGGIVGLGRHGAGTFLLEDGSVTDCNVGIQLQADAGGIPAAGTFTRVLVSRCLTAGINVVRSSVTLERVQVIQGEADGVILRSTASGPSATAEALVRRCELSDNGEANLVLDGNAAVDLSCCNFLPGADGGVNVAFRDAGVAAPAGTLPLTNSYWGLVAPAGEEEIRVETFDRSEVDRPTDLSGYRSMAINFDNPEDPCYEGP